MILATHFQGNSQLIDPQGFGPCGTPNCGRDERIARASRDYAMRCRDAEAQVKREQARREMEIPQLRSLRDWLADERRQRNAQIAELADAIARLEAHR